jgi:hypothetical protein
MELLYVVNCVGCGEIAGEACCEFDATEEVLIDDGGTDVEGMEGRLVWTLDNFARRASGCCAVGAAIVECCEAIVGEAVGESL